MLRRALNIETRNWQSEWLGKQGRWTNSTMGTDKQRFEYTLSNGPAHETEVGFSSQQFSGVFLCTPILAYQALSLPFTTRTKSFDNSTPYHLLCYTWLWLEACR